MKDLKIEIELLSETIFGNGQQAGISVNIDILKDKYGIPYFKGKTFKGKLREEVDQIAEILDMKESVSRLFGKEGSEDNKLLRFSDCKLNKNIINNLIYGIKDNQFTKEDIISGLTDIRTFTKLSSNGVAEDGSLRSARVIKKGLKFYCNITTVKELTDEEKGLLACGISALKNIGGMESRGKGQVKCRLIEDNKDMTYSYINELNNKYLKVGVM